MGFDHTVFPVASLHRDNGKLAQDDGPMDGRGYVLGALNTQTNVTSEGNKCLEPGHWPARGLLLHRHII